MLRKKKKIKNNGVIHEVIAEKEETERYKSRLRER